MQWLWILARQVSCANKRIQDILFHLAVSADAISTVGDFEDRDFAMIHLQLFHGGYLYKCLAAVLLPVAIESR